MNFIPCSRILELHSITSLGCHRQTRATRCVMPIVLYQRWTLSVINCRPTTVAVYHIERPPKLTTLVTINVQKLQMLNFLSPESGTKFQREVPSFLAVPELSSNTE